MKKYILTLLIGIGVLVSIAYAQDYLVVNQGANKIGFILSQIESITHSGNTMTINQNGQSTPYTITSVDSVTFVKATEPDDIAPSIFILSPTSDEVFVTNNQYITVSGVAQDNIALQQVIYSTSTGKNGVAVGTDEWVISDLELELGDNILTVTAIDANNNSTAATITITRNQSITFLGNPLVSPNILYTNESKNVWITASIAPNDNLIASSVKLIEIDENNNVIAEICNLYDNGNLSNGDEIKGDNIFSTIHTFNYSTEGIHYFRISAKTMESQGETEGFSSVFTIKVIDFEEAQEDVLSVEEIHNLIEEKLSELDGLSTDEKAEILVEWLLTLPGVEDAVYNDGCIVITHASGIVSYILLGNDGETKGGVSSRDRSKTPMIPLEKQTRGFIDFTNNFNNLQASETTGDENVISNRNIFIWAPYEDTFNQDMATTLIPIFNDSPIPFNITYLTNQDCTRASLKTLNNYGLVVIDTHGIGGNIMLTREIADIMAGDISQIIDNIDDIISGWCQMVTLEDGNTYYGVTAQYLRVRMEGSMPNSVVFNGSCQSLMSDKLANSFIAKGAKTYLGFTNNVNAKTCIQKANEFFSNLTGNYLKTTGESFNNTGISTYQMRGSKDMHFTLGLINGDFEYGNLNGWNTIGDGRVITQLGSESPTQGVYMGIISTGLGYTENYGRISQTFQVTNENTLSLKWNFLSEEFLEYVGSIYQDYLRITIIDGDDSDVIFNMTVDDFAAAYSLIYVSPTIVFDRGDVYMTGWKTSTFDISRYQGKTITLLIESGDVGDSIYDSATLLDEISVY